MTLTTIAAWRSGRTARSTPSRRFRPQNWLWPLALLLSLAGCAELGAARDAPSYEVMDKGGPTGIKILGFIPDCTSSCLDRVVLKEVSGVGAAPIAKIGRDQAAPRRWFVIHVDQRYNPSPSVQLTAQMIGPRECRMFSSTPVPAYSAAPAAMFNDSMADFVRRFFGSGGSDDARHAMSDDCADVSFVSSGPGSNDSGDPNRPLLD
jgi:hypothetical protein